MKLLSHLLFALCLGFSSFAGNTFEGNLTLTSDKNGTAAGTTVLAVKNDLVAISPGTGPQTVLNVKTGDLQTVVDQGNGQKIVAKLNIGVLSSLPELPSILGPFSDYLGKKQGESQVTKTEETKTISGYKCRKYIMKDADNTTIVWAAEDFPFNLASLMDLLKVTGSDNTSLKASFPMQASIKSNKTSEVSAFKVEVEKKPLDETLFKMPSGMLEMDMTGLVQQMVQTNDPAQIKQVMDRLLPK